MKHGKPRLIQGPAAILGEGPSWDVSSNKLYWVDIRGSQLHVYDPMTEKTQTYDLSQFVCSVVPRQKGGVVLALNHGFYSMDFHTSELELLVKVETDTNIRFNDGKCDPAGRFWAGTMAINHEKGKGKLYCLDTDGSVRLMLEGVTISNGLGWSPDHQTMYYIDTPTRKVFAFDYDVVTGNISGQRNIVEIPNGEGEPDGMAVDEEGMIWVAQIGGAIVSRWNPATGERLQIVELPVPRVTSCTFGGTNLTDLFITTAKTRGRVELSDHGNLEGRLFCCSQTVRGLPTYAYQG
jgi:sugar lactone lactonase YvrE